MATGTGTVKSFRGTDLAKPASFTFEYSAYDSIDAAKAAGVWPNEKDILDGLNSDAERSAKAKAYTETVAKFNALYEKTVTFARENFVAAGIAAKMDEKTVRGIAESQIVETPEMAEAQAQLTTLLNS